MLLWKLKERVKKPTRTPFITTGSRNQLESIIHHWFLEIQSFEGNLSKNIINYKKVIDRKISDGRNPIAINIVKVKNETGAI